MENGFSFSRLVAYVSSLTEVPSAFRSSNEISRLQGARHGRHHNELSCTEDLASPFFMCLDTGVSQKGSMFSVAQNQELYPLSAFAVSTSFQLSTILTAKKKFQNATQTSVGKVPKPQNPGPFGIVAHLQE